MDNRKFELHNLESKDLPFIFHYDVLSKRACSGIFFHWHNNVELLWFTRGNGTVVCDCREHEVDENDIFVINSNMLHSIKTESNLEYYCLIVDADFCKLNGIATEETDYVGKIQSRHVVELFGEVVKEYKQEYKCREAGIKTAIMRLMVSVTRNYSENIKETKNEGISSNEVIKLAIGYIKSHFAQKLTLDCIAREVGLSKFYFSREFKVITGMTPIAYLNLFRCENAKKLLLKGELSIHEIAEKCGYENGSYFSKTFKSQTGYLPSEYAKKQDSAIYEQYK